MFLFLDIDGVLNCSSDWKNENADGFHTLDPKKIDNLKLVFEAMPENSRIVLSSDWRHFQDDGREKLEDLLKERELIISDITPALCWNTKLNSRNIRGHEIDFWLQKHQDDESYIIIDDNVQFLEHQMEFFIETSFDEFDGGLNRQKTQEAISLITKMKNKGFK